MINKVHVKTGDTVVVLSGKERGKKGKVMAVSPKEIINNCLVFAARLAERGMG